MIEQGLLAEGVAPSYFLEGMLYNVPNDKFGNSYADTWVECFNWVVTAQRDELVCANHLHWLVRDNQPTSCATADFLTFLNAVAHTEKGPVVERCIECASEGSKVDCPRPQSGKL